MYSDPSWFRNSSFSTCFLPSWLTPTTTTPHLASKIMSSYQYWLDNGGKVFSLQFNILRPSIFDLKTDENGHSFLSVAQKITHHQTYTKFLQYKKPQNYIFANYKFTSPFTMSNQYTIDHSKITGNLRNYDLIKQYFCLLSHTDTSRPDH